MVTMVFNRFVPDSMPEYFSLREAKVSVRGSARIRGYSSETSLFFNSAARVMDCTLARWIASGLLDGPFFFWGTVSVGAGGGDKRGVGVAEFHRSCSRNRVEAMACRRNVERSPDLFMLLGSFQELGLVPKECTGGHGLVEKVVMRGCGIREKIMHYEVIDEPEASLIRNGSNVLDKSSYNHE